MELFVATNNPHKLDEIRSALPGINVRAPADIGLVFDHPETADTFAGNSFGKAMALWTMVRQPVLADDSGLCVDALGGRPGVLSARYGALPDGSEAPSGIRNRLLLAEMEGVTDRKCRFVCCMTLVMSPDRFLVVQETCEGELLGEERGNGGFGYDPIVWLPSLGCSVAELDQNEKNRISHRGRALARLVPAIEAIPVI